MPRSFLVSRRKHVTSEYKTNVSTGKLLKHLNIYLIHLECDTSGVSEPVNECAK